MSKFMNKIKAKLNKDDAPKTSQSINLRRLES